MAIKSERENIELELAEDNFWYQLSMLGNDDQNPFEPPEATRFVYWLTYFKVVEDFACGIEFDLDSDELPKNFPLSHPQFISLKDLVYEFSKRNEIDYWQPPRMIDFSKVRFVDDVDFTNFIFQCPVSFENAVFDGKTNFSSAAFKGDADFRDVTFTKYASFKDATFTGCSAFSVARFKESACFSYATFTGPAYFRNATFTGYSDFRAATFKTTTDFTDVKFENHPPEFYGASVSEDVFWPSDGFPKPPTAPQEVVAKHKNAYERLALMMSKLEKHHDRHMFWRLEMRARRCLEANWFSRKMNHVYDFFSNYGYGFGKALAWWSGHIILCAFLLFIPAPHNCAGAVNSLATSFANAHSFLGLNRGPLKIVYADYAEWNLFNVFWTIQGLLGIMFLFFLILTIRNRFKMG